MTQRRGASEGGVGALRAARPAALLPRACLSSGPALAAVAAAGAALRLWQYAADTSLWTDELALAKGILALDLRALFPTPLPYNQVAPRGFLLAQKLVVTALGPSDYALRLFPLACGLV